MSGLWIFIALVFLAVFLLVQGTVVPVFGEAAAMRRRLITRLDQVAGGPGEGDLASLLREKYLRELSPLERTLESLPGLDRLVRLIEQAGDTTRAYRVVLASVALAAGVGFAGWLFTRLWSVVAIVAVVGLAVPYVMLMYKRAQRMAKFDEQLPEALDVVKRALKAGHPLVQCLKLVAEDMEDPVSREFDFVFAELNYGSDIRRAMHGLLERMPTVSVMAFITAILLQRETGGNLAETLERITAVIRGRFRLQRRVRTLSAEGRLSAWILALVPLVLFAVISFTTPQYLPMLTKDPNGQALIAAAIVLAIIGILWVRRVIRIDV